METEREYRFGDVITSETLPSGYIHETIQGKGDQPTHVWYKPKSASRLETEAEKPRPKWMLTPEEVKAAMDTNLNNF